MGKSIPIKYKRDKNGKRRPMCDYPECCNFAYVEIYPSMISKKYESSWFYMCKKHLKSETKVFLKKCGEKLPYCMCDKIDCA
ncbi:MAG: hypothetical protein KJ592_05025 [Nanoarchaeota archaeon]|nr:hypothetical protein [Nanoarchaeota archaeon]